MIPTPEKTVEKGTAQKDITQKDTDRTKHNGQNDNERRDYTIELGNKYDKNGEYRNQEADERYS